MPSSSAVIIGAADLLPALKKRAGVDDHALAFPDSEPLQALEAITLNRPDLIVMERFFAATPRGAALIHRIKADPTLANSEIRVLSHDGAYSRVVVRRTAAPPEAPAAKAAPVAPPRNFDWRGTRRAPRFRIRDGIALQVDGHSARLIDLSRIGAQVIYSRMLRPEQKVRVALPSDPEVVRFGASVAWVRFEVPKGQAHYRVGLEFQNADAKAIDAFCKRYKQ